VTEREFSQAVSDLAKMRGFLSYHTHDSRRSAPGFPDWVFVKPPRLIFAELKTEKGKLSPAQADWIAVLGDVPGVEVYVWRPSQLDEIAEVLK
jgi:hypothetical protein